jgi:hypothetical protein
MIIRQISTHVFQFKFPIGELIQIHMSYFDFLTQTRFN